MTKYLISFPAAAMQVPEDELPAVSDAAHAVVREAQKAGVWVFGEGIDENSPPELVEADGSTRAGTHPQTGVLNGGMSVLELGSRDAALTWAAKFAAACRCAQEVRVFGIDAES